ncbi:RCC1 and BTB domain-containing protein 1-like [Centruroides sculpturatus]|uniref:RCC1 and BTB domain-containing protein 1-like n=1 Tax=Centruroides sculpturatus TaxID=218467 RepID=UPI000C6CA45D|nr:RCC1 and BTB domain-containing protein 1-like [Centruroides sculpturatus]
MSLIESMSFLYDDCGMADIDKWLIFSILSREFLTNIKIACVFGSSGNEALIVTKDDEVYALGSNTSGCLGLGDSHGSLEPRKVESLHRKGIKTFAYGSGPHVLAVTEDGEIYSWGHNGYCQLGNGSTNQGLFPGLISSSLIGRKVKEVACGSHHSMVLTKDDEVYALGSNTSGCLGLGDSHGSLEPRKVITKFLIGSRRCISIACGQTSSMCALDNGDVYGWGYNGNGQLGLGNNVNQSNPSRVANLQGVVIQKIVCGYAHTMALSDEGVLYAWGANSYGQLGTGSKANQVTPVRIASEIGRIVEIAASHYNHISAAMSQTSKVFMWGQCRGQSITVPTETPFHSLHDVFACFASPAVTWVPMKLDISDTSRVNDSLQQAFDDPVTSDLKICVEGKVINVHKSILKIRIEEVYGWGYNGNGQLGLGNNVNQSNPSRVANLQGVVIQKQLYLIYKCFMNLQSLFFVFIRTVDISQFTYPVYRAFLQYLYTDDVDLSPEDAIGLLDLANSYCETQLKRHCERIIRYGISIENVAMLYAAAIKYEAKELEEFCFRFALNHLTAVAQTEAFNKLDETIVKNFICKAAQHGAFKY